MGGLLKDKEINLMLDLETMGTRPGSVILSIAAVPFLCQYPIDNFYQKIDSVSSMEAGLKTDKATAAWWEKQDAAIREEAFSGVDDIRVVLYKFAEYCSILPSPPKIWGNGSDFDNVLLETAYNITSIDKPWKFTDNRCYRTLKGVFHFIPYQKPKQAHNALEDAKAQAAHAVQIYKWIDTRSFNNGLGA